jgi:hypothetical protein
MRPGFVEPAASDDLKVFDAALCEGLKAAPVAVFLIAARLVFPDLAFAAVADLVRRDWPRSDLGDFLRDFLDIRLPFVAFRGSIIGLSPVSSGVPKSSRRRLGKSDCAGVRLQGIQCAACPLVE